jgi:hypothetical protein
MTGPLDTVRSRILPALLTAVGVTLLAAGLLSYTEPVDAGPAATPSTSPIGVAPTAVPTPSPLITLPPIPSATPATPTASALPEGVATRIRIAALDIDMPVIEGPPGYPPCDVAMYLKELGQPGQGKATYLYGHARDGMFLPLLETRGPDQRGLVVEVWTSDDLRYLYEIVEVRRDQTTLDDALAAESEELWMQTSEGPRGTVGKTQVIALPISVDRSTPEESSPEANPIDCS